MANNKTNFTLAYNGTDPGTAQVRGTVYSY